MGRGGGPIVPEFVNLSFNGGTLTGTIQGLTDGLIATDVWANGVGTFSVVIPDEGVLLAGSNIVSAVSPVPVPAAVWLFGTALVGFIGLSRRRKVA